MSIDDIQNLFTYQTYRNFQDTLTGRFYPISHFGTRRNQVHMPASPFSLLCGVRLYILDPEEQQQRIGKKMMAPIIRYN